MAGPTLANETFARKVMPRVPARRWGTGADFAGIAVYLASPASPYHTGDWLLIDGGYASF
jgi:NAD(P)-dependent dehydrogenase (short-subunit alcohol dehydrogenase family)